MADQIKDKEASAEAVGTVTTATPAEADKTSDPGPGDAKPNQPPVRTNRPDVPIADSLAAGAGAHEGRELDQVVEVAEPTGEGSKTVTREVAVDADGIDADGRFVGEPKGSKK